MMENRNKPGPDVSTIIGMAGSRAADIAEDAEVFALLSRPDAQRRDILERLAVAGQSRRRSSGRDDSEEGSRWGDGGDDNRSRAGSRYGGYDDDDDEESRETRGGRGEEEEEEEEEEEGEGDEEEEKEALRIPQLSTREDMLDDERSAEQRRMAIPVEGLRERTERQALVEKLSVFESCGFKIAPYDPKVTTIEELKAMVKRRELIDSTMSYVDIAIDWIVWIAKILETANGLFGILPMDNYAKQVEENTKKPRFKYAMYCLIMKYGGAGGFLGPWKEIALVLLLPILQAIAFKVIMLISKARGVPMSADLVSMGVNEGANKINRFFGRSSDTDNDGGGLYGGSSHSSDASSDDDDDGDDDDHEYFPSSSSKQKPATTTTRSSVEIEEPPPFIIPARGRH